MPPLFSAQQLERFPEAFHHLFGNNSPPTFPPGMVPHFFEIEFGRTLHLNSRAQVVGFRSWCRQYWKGQAADRKQQKKLETKARKSRKQAEKRKLERQARGLKQPGRPKLPPYLLTQQQLQDSQTRPVFLRLRRTERKEGAGGEVKKRSKLHDNNEYKGREYFRKAFRKKLGPGLYILKRKIILQQNSRLTPDFGIRKVQVESERGKDGELVAIGEFKTRGTPSWPVNRRPKLKKWLKKGVEQAQKYSALKPNIPVRLQALVLDRGKLVHRHINISNGNG